MENQIALNIQELQQEVINTVKRTGDLMQKASQQMRSDSLKQKYSEFEQEVAETLLSVENLELRVAIVAPMSAGKSTLVNAMVGQELLPSRTTDMTAFPTKIVFNPKLDEPVLYFSDKILTVLESAIKDLYKRIDYLGYEEVNQRLSKYVGLKEIAEKLIKSNIGFDAKVHGYEKINNDLTEFNDFVRLCSVLDPDVGNQLIQVLDIPCIETPFLKNEGFISDKLGNIAIIDTPGPNAVGSLRRELLIREQLKNSEVVLMVLDFTALKTDAQERIKNEVDQIVKVIGQDSLYIIVNKIDQRKHDNPLTSEKIKELVTSDFEINHKNNADYIFEVSGRRAFCAASFMQKRQQYPELKKEELEKLEKLEKLETVKSLAEEVFGIDWEKDLEETTIDFLEKKAKTLWEKSGFNSFLDNVISVLLIEAAPQCLKRALKRSEYRLISVKDDFIATKSMISGGKEKINQQLQDLNDDRNTIEWEKEKILEKVDQILIEMREQIDYILNTGFNDIQVGKLKNKLAQEKINNKLMTFYSQQEAKIFLRKIIGIIVDHIEKVIAEKTKEIVAILDYYIEKTSALIKKSLEELIEKTRIRIQNEFNIDLEWKFPDFIVSTEIKDNIFSKVDIKTEISIWGRLHNAFVSPLNVLNLNIPIVQEKYCIDVQSYIQEAVSYANLEVQNAKDYVQDFSHNQFRSLMLQRIDYYIYFLTQQSEIFAQSIQQKELSKEQFDDLQQKIGYILEMSNECLKQVEEQLNRVEQLIKY